MNHNWQENCEDNYPIKLKMTCTSAARFAAIEPAKLAKIAVIVVPILSPSNTGIAAFKLIKSC